jgi:TonB-linked SusC/RagA family outer membrane protein
MAPLLFMSINQLYKLTDERHQPMPGVSVRLKGTKLAWVSNTNGEVNAILSNNEGVLEFSFVGYTTQAIPVSKLTNPMTIQMKQDAGLLDDVQITAYGSTTKRLNTGNQVTIKAEDIEKNPVNNVFAALQGHVPGMFITEKSGQPGRPFDIKIRGVNSISGSGNANSYPLVVVDGVAYPTVNLPFIGGQLNTDQQGGNGLNYLNPEMIESVDVLKDADATAIYGSRGAYGVILITTKKGKAGTPRFSLNTQTGLTYRGTTPQLLNTDQYLMIRREAFKNDGTKPGTGDLDLNGTWPTDRNVDWGKQFYKNYAVATNSYATYSGGTDNVNYLVGANFNFQNDIQRGAGSVRGGGLNFNLNASSPNKKLDVSLTGTYSSTVNTEVQYEVAVGGELIPSVTAAPNAPPMLNPDGTLDWTDWQTNPASNANQLYKNVTNNLIANTQLNYRPVAGLTLHAGFSYNVLSGNEIAGRPSTYFNPNSVFTTTSTLNQYNVSTWTFEPNANYTHKLGKQGQLTVTTGATMQRYINTQSQITGSDFPSDALLVNPTFANTANISTSLTQIPRKYLGYFGIINYNWANKYIINLTGRYDGSSKFGKDRQFGTFGSVGAAYIVSEEPWFKNNISFINFAKIRGSYGSVGGDGITDYAFLSTYANSTTYQGQLGLVPSKLENPDLQWEKNRKTDIGINVEFLGGKISIDAAYYNNITSNQLVPQILSNVTGFGGISKNRDAIIRNYGYEFTVSTKNITTKKFSWLSSINVTLPHNILEAYPDIATSGSTAYVIGKPVTGTKLYNYAGVNPQTGNYNFINRNGVVGDFSILSPLTLSQTLDKTAFVDFMPKFYGGLTNTLRYSKLTLDFTFTFSSQMGKNFMGSQFFIPGSFNANPSVKVLDRWQQPGDITDVPKVSAGGLYGFFAQNNFITSTGAYSRNTYARLANVSLYYAVPTTMLQKAGISALNIFVKGQNLLTISKYGDLDPENLGAGLAPLRIITGGLNVTF